MTCDKVEQAAQSPWPLKGVRILLSVALDIGLVLGERLTEDEQWQCLDSHHCNRSKAVFFPDNACLLCELLSPIVDIIDICLGISSISLQWSSTLLRESHSENTTKRMSRNKNFGSLLTND